MNHRQKAEQFGEAFALDYLEDTLGHDVFIGALIERLVADEAHVIYQWVDDEAYFGAAITSPTKEQFIAINTFHPLRFRYFTAAHELWHLTKASVAAEGDPTFDHERAADRFAAAIMLPKALTKSLWQRFRKKYPPEEAVLRLADMAAVPYETVARRLKELDEKPVHPTWDEEAWRTYREEVKLPGSPFDQPIHEQQFIAYEQTINQMVNTKGLDKLTAANKLSPYAPKQAERYQQDVVAKDQHDGT